MIRSVATRSTHEADLLGYFYTLNTCVPNKEQVRSAKVYAEWAHYYVLRMAGEASVPCSRQAS